MLTGIGISGSNSTLNFYDGIITSGVTSTAISKYSTVTINTADGYDIYTYDDSGREVAILSNNPDNMVAMISETNTYYTTLQAAFNATTSTQSTIVVLKDIELDSTATLTEGKNAILNTAGHTISRNASSVYVLNNQGTLTITGTGTISNSSGYGITNSGTLTIGEEGKTNGPTIKANGTNGIYNTGTLTVNTGTISGNNRGIHNSGSAAKSYINGGDISATSASSTVYAVYNVSGTIYMEKGNISTESTSSSAYGLYNYSGTTEIKGGNIESEHGQGIRIYQGTVTLGDQSTTPASTTTPSVSGGTYGVYENSGTFNFYDGIIKGAQSSGAIYGTANIPDGYEINYSTANNIQTATLKKLITTSDISSVQVKTEYVHYIHRGEGVQATGSDSITRGIDLTGGNYQQHNALSITTLTFFDSDGNQLTDIISDEIFSLSCESKGGSNYFYNGMTGAWGAVFADDTPIQYIHYDIDKANSYDMPETFSTITIYCYRAENENPNGTAWYNVRLTSNVFNFDRTSYDNSFNTSDNSTFEAVAQRAKAIYDKIPK